MSIRKSLQATFRVYHADASYCQAKDQYVVGCHYPLALSWAIHGRLHRLEIIMAMVLLDRDHLDRDRPCCGRLLNG